MREAIKINALDNVAVAIVQLPKGSVHLGVTLKEDIAAGHKFALVDIAKGSSVIKYGNPIGAATAQIEVGSHVHTHNVRTGLDENLQYTFNKKPTKAQKAQAKEVNVYVRQNGAVGIRNEIWIVPTVGCVNAQAREIANRLRRELHSMEIDGVYALEHPYGCSQVGDDHEFTKRILQKIVLHPNAGGVLVLGLGCENNQIEQFRAGLGNFDEQRIRFLQAQDVQDEIESGLKIVRELYEVVRNDKRSKRSIGVLNIGLKCGGSDGLSGITANPLLGAFSDYLIACGGASVLTEVPEMFGAEHLLMERAKDRAVFDKTVQLVNDFKDYYRRNGQDIYENPSPGNKAGGITTLEDKSLGCTQKGGSSEVCDVLKDGEVISNRGLSLLNGPGNDMVAVTNLGAAGCHMVLFTTGRGTPFGGFVPTVKVATNSALAQRKGNWIDFDAGKALAGDILPQLIDYVVSVANGARVKHEELGAKEIAIFKNGVTL